MKIIKLFTVLTIMAVLSSPIINAKLNSEDKASHKKGQVVKITNTGKVITIKQLEQIDPKTIESIDVRSDTIFISMREKNQKDKTKKSN